MNIIAKNEIESLIHEQQWPAISIYMPVSRIGDQQDAIRFKNILDQVESSLIAGGMRAPEARSFLEAEYKLAKDNDYWKHLGVDGLAVFRSKELELRYPLPVAFREFVQVGHRFHIKPLIPLLESERYLVLALSKSSIRLYQGDRFHFEKIELPEGTPKSMEEVLRFDDPERQLQYHTRTATPGGDAKRGAMYHGQGVGIDEEKSNLDRYVQAVDRQLFPLLDTERCPILLAGGEELLAAYRRITRSRNILPDGVLKNVSDLPEEELHRLSREMTTDYFTKEEKEAAGILRNSLGTGLVADDLPSVLVAANDGRVDTLFIAENEEVWGNFDPESQQTTVRKKTGDGELVELIDEAAFRTFNTKGRIFVRERAHMPCDGVVCAHLRF